MVQVSGGMTVLPLAIKYGVTGNPIIMEVTKTALKCTRAEAMLGNGMTTSAVDMGRLLLLFARRKWRDTVARDGVTVTF